MAETVPWWLYLFTLLAGVTAYVSAILKIAIAPFLASG
jgi:hypothetical protein